MDYPTICFLRSVLPAQGIFEILLLSLQLQVQVRPVGEVVGTGSPLRPPSVVRSPPTSVVDQRQPVGVLVEFRRSTLRASAGASTLKLPTTKAGRRIGRLPERSVVAELPPPLFAAPVAVERHRGHP